jgi:hypothetical protein
VVILCHVCSPCSVASAAPSVCSWLSQLLYSTLARLHCCSVLRYSAALGMCCWALFWYGPLCFGLLCSLRLLCTTLLCAALLYPSRLPQQLSLLHPVCLVSTSISDASAVFSSRSLCKRWGPLCCAGRYESGRRGNGQSRGSNPGPLAP